jgi:hypothetical protein
MRWKIGIETPCHTTPTTISTMMEATTTCARRPSLCGPSLGNTPSFAWPQARTMHRKPTWLMPVSIGCAWRAAGR